MHDGWCFRPVRIDQTGRLDAAVPAGLYRTDLAARAGADRRRHPGPGTPHRSRRPARYRPRSGPALYQLPPSAEPQPVVKPLARALPVAAVDRDLCSDRAGHRRPRRHHRAALGCQNQSTRHLSRSCPLIAQPCRQSEWPAMAVAYVVAADPMGRACLGIAVPDRPGTVRTLCARATTAVQEADRLGPTDAASAGALAARASHHRGHRRQLRRH